MASKNYHEQLIKENNIKLRELLKSLPGFCAKFFHGIEENTSSRTRIAYAYDLTIFFNYLKNETNFCGSKEITELEISILDKLAPIDLQGFVDYIKYYNNTEDVERINQERGVMRKMSCIKSFYNYFYRMEMIKNNPASILTLPKLHEKEIVRLDVDEVARLLDTVENGEQLTKKQQAYHEKTKVRDLAIITLLLGTGIRVSECVGLNIDDVDFKNYGIKIRRKGGNEVVVYFGDEVDEALMDYLCERKQIIAQEGHEDALFLSMQNRRITVRSVENLVKKYSRLVTQLKNITPHKLRSTYGTTRYRETGDIYLVADVLGHSDVNTTKKHYAALEDERRRMARNKVTLREDKE